MAESMEEVPRARLRSRRGSQRRRPGSRCSSRSSWCSSVNLSLTDLGAVDEPASGARVLGVGFD